MKVATFFSVSVLLIASTLAQSACSGQQYNTLPGYPASNSGCYPTNYQSTSDLGSTSPSDAQTRCSAQCASIGSSCGSYVALVNKAADSNNYSGTCFFFSLTSPAGAPRQCVDKAYLLVGYSKDFTNACFSSSAAVASAYCSSYLGIPVITLTATSTSTPAAVTSTITVTYYSLVVSTTTVPVTATTTTTTTTTTTITSTSIAAASFLIGKRAAERIQNIRRAAPAPACISSNTPATRVSAACSCLSVKTSTTTTTTTLIPATTSTTATATVVITSVTTTRVTTVTNTVTATVTMSVTVTLASSNSNSAQPTCTGLLCVSAA